MADQVVAYCGDHVALARLMGREKIYVDTRDRSLAPHLMLDGYWEAWVTKVFVDLVQPGACVLDIGASFGVYTLLAASIVGPQGLVVAVEPLERPIELLSWSVDINGVADRVMLRHAAVGDIVGRRWFRLSASHSGCSSFWEPGMSAGPCKVIDVDVTTVDQLCVDVGRSPNLIKIDAEGAELEVLRGADDLLSQPRDLTIILEVNPFMLGRAGTTPRELIDLLLAHRFNLALITPDGPAPVKVEEFRADGVYNLLARRPRARRDQGKR